MLVLGISGFPGSISFKKKQYPNLDPRCYRMVQGLDSAAALVTPEGTLAAVAEERLNREKGTNAFPEKAIRYCCEAAGLPLSQIDFVAHSFDYRMNEDVLAGAAETKDLYTQVLSPDRIFAEFESVFPNQLRKKNFIAVPHHAAHAASAFYESGFEESLVFVMDGMGESDGISVFVGEGSSLHRIHRIPARGSLGLLYGIMTHYLGFQMNQDEYKVMGLAPFGNSKNFEFQCSQMVQFQGEEGWVIPCLSMDRSQREVESHEGCLRYLEMLFGPRRKPGAELTARDMDLAAALQSLLEGSVLRLFSHFRQKTGIPRACMAGGVALNCAANGIILRSQIFQGLHIHSAAGDDGSSLGAARYVLSQQGELKRHAPKPLPFWGPSFSEDQIQESLEAVSEDVIVQNVDSDEALTSAIADELAEDKVVAWFQGRAEFGPRALGNRSILANPRSADTRERINEVIKQRESFRPFAPAVIEEELSVYFEAELSAETSLETMLFVVPTRVEYRERLGAVCHVDGSARVQTVSHERHPLFWKLLVAVGKRTGIPILLNTSFNVDEPIVTTPRDACMTFLNSAMDVLVLGRSIVRKQPA